jgi:geranylgeranyl pyrophosphate synthase
MSVALASVFEAPGLDTYLTEVEFRLEEAVGSYPGRAAEAGAEALEGGKRLRPLLIYLASPAGSPPRAAVGAAVELVHMATLVHDDLIDGAKLRHGHPTVWSVHGSGDVRAMGILAEAAVSLSRGEALQRRQAGDPETTIESYLERCALKTGKLFEAACRLAGGPGAFGLALGVAFQIADDILDCTGDAEDTGKVPGTDLREGTPTLPLILAAREDVVVRRALTGGPLDGALVRVAQTSALDESREKAEAYAEQARRSLEGGAFRDELEALTYLVVDRKR